MDIGLSLNVLNCLRSYLMNMWFCVEVDGIRSDWLAITCGVPQISILESLLFVLYMNDINFTITHCKYHMYYLQFGLHFTASDINDRVLNINYDIKQAVT